jgi:hypothetical protein
LEGCVAPHAFYVAGDCLRPSGRKRGDHLISMATLCLVAATVAPVVWRAIKRR